jgi:hypothetical protein
MSAAGLRGRPVDMDCLHCCSTTQATEETVRQDRKLPLLVTTHVLNPPSAHVLLRGLNFDPQDPLSAALQVSICCPLLVSVVSQLLARALHHTWVQS